MNDRAADDDVRFGTHLSLSVRGMRSSPTVAINELSDALRSQGKRVFKLGLGQSPFPVPLPVVDALKENAAQKAYLPVRGLRPLREAVADHQRRLHGVACSGDQVLVAPGSKELMFLLQLVYYGELVIPTPAWVSYAPQATLAGRTTCFLHAHERNGWRLDPSQLGDLCRVDPERPRIVVLNYPSNPTGATYTSGELEAIAEVARRFRLILLSDEIYGQIHHRGEHVSVARYYPEGTIVSSGLSKWCGAGGWRLGTFTFPPKLTWLLDAMAAVASETYTSTSAPIQYAAVRAFQGGLEIERYLTQVRRILSALGQAIVEKLSRAGLRVERPDGAFYVFPSFAPFAAMLRERGIHGSTELAARLLEEIGVALLPGSVFGRPEQELNVRVAYVDFDGAKALAAAEQIPSGEAIEEGFLRTHCGQVMTAIDEICTWLG